MFDVAVIGSGPAGCAAALFAARRGMRTVIFDDPMSMSQMEEAPTIDDWLGTRNKGGLELVESFREHVRDYGVEIKSEKVVEVGKEGKAFRIRTEKSDHNCKAVIFATGAKHRKAMIKGESEFAGKGVSYCASCDGPLCRGKDVIVIGGGDTAVNSAILLSDIGAKVTLIHKKGDLRADNANQKRLRATKTKILWNTLVDEIRGEKAVSAAIIRNVNTSEAREMKTDGVFISIGSVPIAELAKNIGIKLDDSGYIVVDEEQRTNIGGVFAAGDCTNRIAKKILTAAGYGAAAATSAYEWIKQNP